LYGCETWSLTLREGYKLRIFQNGVQMRMFGSKKMEIRGVWRKLHNEELYNSCSSPDIIRVMKLKIM
jgi:hypothetical protein